MQLDYGGAVVASCSDEEVEVIAAHSFERLLVQIILHELASIRLRASGDRAVVVGQKSHQKTLVALLDVPAIGSFWESG